MMESSFGPLQLLMTWGVPLLYIFGNLIILVACVAGAIHPTLRKEFVFLALGTLMRVFGGVVPLVTNTLLKTNAGVSSSSHLNIVMTTGYVNAALGMFAMLFYLVGIGLLALRVRTLPVVR